MASISPPPIATVTPPFQKQACRQSPLSHILMLKQKMSQQQSLASTPQLSYISEKKAREYQILRQPRRTNPAVWCAAVICLIFSLLLIFCGIATLIIFVSIKPKNPVFETPAASLNLIYLDYPQFYNGDFTLLANFSNPNRKLDVSFEHLDIELYYSDSLIASRILQPFSQRPGEAKLLPVHLVSSLVYFPPKLAFEVQKQVQSNKVAYTIKGTFRIRVSLGLIHYSYWLHGRCQLELTGPPTGVLITHSCKTKR